MMIDLGTTLFNDKKPSIQRILQETGETLLALNVTTLTYSRSHATAIKPSKMYAG